MADMINQAVFAFAILKNDIGKLYLLILLRFIKSFIVSSHNYMYNFIVITLDV